MDKNSRIYVAGHQGMAGSAIVRELRNEGYLNLLMHTSTELDLRDQDKARYFFANEKPEYVFMAAASTGGINANRSRPAEFLYDNLMMQANVIHESKRVDVRKLLLVASSEVYPQNSASPLGEIELLAGPLEPSFEAYGLSKIAGIKVCQAYRKQYGCDFFSIISADIYGANDKYNTVNARVIPSLIQKIADAKYYNREAVEVWGTGTIQKDFIHSADFADACLFLMNQENVDDVINIGTGDSTSIGELAKQIQSLLHYDGKLLFNPGRPDLRSSRQLEISKIRQLGWEPQIRLTEGLKNVCDLYLAEHGLPVADYR